MSEIKNRKSISDDLNVYDYLAKKEDFIEITEWINEEGWDICIKDQNISLTAGQLDAINHLTNILKYHR